MKNYLILITILLASICIQIPAAAQNVNFSPSIIKATQEANAEKLAENFDQKVELVLPGKNGVFSKSQAKLILNNFFKQNPPKKFEIIHKGMRESSAYAIGKYTSDKGQYRFYFLTKKKDAETYIHQIRIEKQND